MTVWSPRVHEKSCPAFDGRYPGMPWQVWDTRIALVRSIHEVVGPIVINWAQALGERECARRAELLAPLGVQRGSGNDYAWHPLLRFFSGVRD